MVSLRRDADNPLCDPRHHLPTHEGVSLDLDDLASRAEQFANPFRVTSGRGFKLSQYDPADTLHLEAEDKPRAAKALADGVLALAEMQEMLYAQDRWAVLVVFQAMDAAGKDSVIKHVLSGVNPQGCHVTSFKTPSAEELDHDFLWRCVRHLPERGRIGIFNRSYYEDVLVVRVHPEILARQKIPPRLLSNEIWNERFEDIASFERYLARQGIAICKFFLHVSKAEQKRRFLERIDNPRKNWKFAAGDVVERGHWDQYQAAYEDMIRHTATEAAPWYVVPADNKWFTRLVVSAGIVHAVWSLGLGFPTVDERARAELQEARRALVNEKD
jgi:PPK2 family polyphosphate:nucleotide phosphotransferase